MEYLQPIGIYLVFSVICFYVMYMNAVDLTGRLDYSQIDTGTFAREMLSEQKAILKLLWKDFFQVHCPWSKKRSIKYRVKDAHDVLLYSEHEKGWKAKDCHNPANHAQIAHDCFQYRSTFWAQQLFVIFTAPIRLALLCGIILIEIVGIICWNSARTVWNLGKTIFAR